MKQKIYPWLNYISWNYDKYNYYEPFFLVKLSIMLFFFSLSLNYDIIIYYEKQKKHLSIIFYISWTYDNFIIIKKNKMNNYMLLRMMSSHHGIFSHLIQT